MFSSWTMPLVLVNLHLEVYSRNSGAQRWVMSVTIDACYGKRYHFQEKLQSLGPLLQRKGKAKSDWCLSIGHLARWPMLVSIWPADWCPSSNPPLLANSPQFIYWAWCPMVWNIPLASSGQLPRLCSLPPSCTPACWHSMGKRKILNLG